MNAQPENLNFQGIDNVRLWAINGHVPCKWQIGFHSPGDNIVSKLHNSFFRNHLGYIEHTYYILCLVPCVYYELVLFISECIAFKGQRNKIKGCLLKYVQVIVRLHIFLIFSFLAKMLSFLHYSLRSVWVFYFSTINRQYNYKLSVKKLHQ